MPAGLPDGIAPISECPITFEQFEEKGRNQPMFLPVCGHTFSREGVQSLLKKTREEEGLTGKRAKGKPVAVKCPHCSSMQKPGTIDDFNPNWSVIQQIQEIKQQMATAREEAESNNKGQPAEDNDVSEQENTHSQHHKTAPAEAATARAPQPDHEVLEHLHIADDPQPVNDAVYNDHQESTGSTHAAPFRDPGVSNSKSCDEPEEEVWQTWVDPPVASSSIPNVILQNRAACLALSQVASNRSALSGEMYTLVYNAVKPYLSNEDLFGVSQALSDIMINGASSTSALVDCLARRIPVLHHIGTQWMYVADTGLVDSEEEVVGRARKAHKQIESTERERMRKAAAAHPSLNAKDPMLVLKREEVVKVRVGTRLADRSYAGVMGCGGYMLEDSPMEDVAPRESPMECMKRLSKLKDALESVYDMMPMQSDMIEDILVPSKFFCAAAAAFNEIIPPMPATQLAAAHTRVLSGMLQSKIEAMLTPAYGPEAGSALATNASRLLCDNAPNADSLLALCSGCSSELPIVIESAVDYLICSDPACLEPTPPELVANPPLPPHLAYIQGSRMTGFNAEDFICAHDRAIAINALFATGDGDKGGGFQEVQSKNRGRHIGNHGSRNVAAAPNGHAGRVGGLGALGVRPGAGRGANPAPAAEGPNQGNDVLRRMYGDAAPPAGGGAGNKKKNKNKMHQRSDSPEVQNNNHVNNITSNRLPRLYTETTPAAGTAYRFTPNQNPNPSAHAPTPYHLHPGQNLSGGSGLGLRPSNGSLGVRPGNPPQFQHHQPHQPQFESYHQQHHHPQHHQPQFKSYHQQQQQFQPVHVPQQHHQRGHLHLAPHRPPPMAVSGVSAIPVIDMPRNSAYIPVDEVRGKRQQLPVRPGDAECSHFGKFGWCLYGDSCAHDHPGGQSVISNLAGMPIRPGVKVCKYYMLNGECAYGMNCHFNHPNICPATGPNKGEVIARKTAFDEL